MYYYFVVIQSIYTVNTRNGNIITAIKFLWHKLNHIGSKFKKIVIIDF